MTDVCELCGSPKWIGRITFKYVGEDHPLTYLICENCNGEIREKVGEMSQEYEKGELEI